MRNRTEHGFSWLTAISDAGSTPAASTIYNILASNRTPGRRALTTASGPTGPIGHKLSGSFSNDRCSPRVRSDAIYRKGDFVEACWTSQAR